MEACHSDGQRLCVWLDSSGIAVNQRAGVDGWLPGGNKTRDGGETTENR